MKQIEHKVVWRPKYLVAVAELDGGAASIPKYRVYQIIGAVVERPLGPLWNLTKDQLDIQSERDFNETVEEADMEHSRG